VCVSRSKIKDYSIKDGEILHRIKTQNKEESSIQRVHLAEQTDYILRVKSPGKKLKEDAMKKQFEERFEEDPRALLEQAKQIVRIANTQKVVYSTAKNKMYELIEIKKCSEPSDKLKEIYAFLKIKNHPLPKNL